MADAIPQNANEFIEQQLNERILAIESAFEADTIGFSGGLFPGVDDVIRVAIEKKKAEGQGRERLVVILTTSGGIVEVVNRIVDTLRHHYLTVDFVVPNYAFSAGTVLVMSGDAIWMNYYSRLVPALGYLEQWDRLLRKAQAGTLTTAEMHLMVHGFDQAELYEYEQARDLSISLLEEWLVKYKFKNWTLTQTHGRTVTATMKRNRARNIAQELSKASKWHSHGRGISMEVLRRDLNLIIEDFDGQAVLGNKIKGYYNLLDDYMGKLDHDGVLHMNGYYKPFTSV